MRVAETAAHFFPNTTQTTLGYFFAIASFFSVLGFGLFGSRSIRPWDGG